jgi:putative ABC transport system permease protein
MKPRELARFALQGLWRQKVRTALTLVGVTVGTAALGFSLALGFGLRAFIENEFRSKPEFWRLTVRAGEPKVDADDLPPEKVTVRGDLAEDRKARIKDALVTKYLNEGPRVPPVLIDRAAVARMAALPGVSEVRTFRVGTGRAWAADRSAPGTVAAGRLGALEPRLLAGRLPRDGAAEVLVSEFILYELGVRDEAGFAAAVGRPVRVEVGGVKNAQPLALARALTGRPPDDYLTGPQERALAKLTAALPGALDQFPLSADDRAELRGLMAPKPGADRERPWESGAVAAGEYAVAGVVRLLTREDKKKADPLAGWEVREGDVFLPPAAGDALFEQLPWAKDVGFPGVEVRVTPGGDLPGTVAAVEAMGFETFSALKWFNSAKKEVTLIAAGLNLFALIALLVAGIGITNTLVTSVVERTREIGILKAVGATRGQVLAVFLAEGALIGLAGGAVGVALARLAAIPADGYVRGLIEQQIRGEKLTTETIFVFPAWLWAGAFLFAVLVTTAAAYYPAHRAAGIDPIRALKYE